MTAPLKPNPDSPAFDLLEAEIKLMLDPELKQQALTSLQILKNSLTQDNTKAAQALIPQTTVIKPTKRLQEWKGITQGMLKGATLYGGGFDIKKDIPTNSSPVANDKYIFASAAFHNAKAQGILKIERSTNSETFIPLRPWQSGTVIPDLKLYPTPLGVAYKLENQFMFLPNEAFNPDHSLILPTYSELPISAVAGSDNKIIYSTSKQIFSYDLATNIYHDITATTPALLRDPKTVMFALSPRHFIAANNSVLSLFTEPDSPDNHTPVQLWTVDRQRTHHDTITAAFITPDNSTIIVGSQKSGISSYSTKGQLIAATPKTQTNYHVAFEIDPANSDLILYSKSLFTVYPLKDFMAPNNKLLPKAAPQVVLF